MEIWLIKIVQILFGSVLSAVLLWQAGLDQLKGEKSA